MYNDKVYAILNKREITRDYIETSCWRQPRWSLDQSKGILCWKTWEDIPRELRKSCMQHEDVYKLIFTDEWYNSEPIE